MHEVTILPVDNGYILAVKFEEPEFGRIGIAPRQSVKKVFNTLDEVLAALKELEPDLIEYP